MRELGRREKRVKCMVLEYADNGRGGGGEERKKGKRRKIKSSTYKV